MLLAVVPDDIRKIQLRPCGGEPEAVPGQRSADEPPARVGRGYAGNEDPVVWLVRSREARGATVGSGGGHSGVDTGVKSKVSGQHDPAAGGSSRRSLHGIAIDRLWSAERILVQSRCAQHMVRDPVHPSPTSPPRTNDEIIGVSSCRV